jgi:hypothetical protein
VLTDFAGALTGHPVRRPLLACRGVAARLASGPAVPGRRLVAAGHRGMASLAGPGCPASWPPVTPGGPGRAAGPADLRGPGGRVRSACPVTLPAGLALAGLTWAWRNYAVTAGLAGIMASAPITFDARR